MEECESLNTLMEIFKLIVNDSYLIYDSIFEWTMITIRWNTISM